MTINQMEILAQDKTYTGKHSVERAIASAVEMMGAGFPYEVKVEINGEQVIWFTEHFISVAREALSDGRTTRMSVHELQFWLAYIEYEQDLVDGVRDTVVPNSRNAKRQEAALAAFKIWMEDELAGIEHPADNVQSDQHLGEY